MDMKEKYEIILQWYFQNRRDLHWRKEPRDPYRVWLSEVMLQQTRVDTVMEYFEKFLRRFPTIYDLAKADESEVLKYWEGMGYYQRARNLWKAGRLIMDRFGGVIPDDEKELGELPGIGGYISAAIRAFGYQQLVPVMDSNVLRVIQRMEGLELEKQSLIRKRVSEILSAQLLQTGKWELNEAVMELGALVCSARQPRCHICPVQNSCMAFRLGKVDTIPRPKKKGRIPEYRVVVGLIFADDKLYIQKRTWQSHLGGLWEFPGGRLERGEKAESAVKREIWEETGMEIQQWQYLGKIRHQYSHFKIEMEIFWTVLEREMESTHEEYLWCPITELERYAFPAANHKIFEIIRAIDGGWNFYKTEGVKKYG